MADETQEKNTKQQVSDMTRLVRSRVAQVIWVFSVIAALLLATGALLVVLGANHENALVSFVGDAAQTLDLGVFDRFDGIKTFTNEDGSPDRKINALFNWGLGALAWLVGGRIVSGLVRP